MALIKCPACAQYVSDEADICLGCGYPIKRGQSTQAGPDKPQAVSEDSTLEDLRRLCATTAAAFREGHQLAAGSREHSEKNLVWLAGLMGAAIFSTQALLGSAPPSTRLVAFVPWTLGILCAMASRLLGGELQNRSDMQHFKRISMLDLLQLETDRTLIVRNLRPIIEAGTFGKDPESRQIKRLLDATNGAFYFAHVCFAVGVVGAVTTMILWGK
jgi:hypothetical protein